MRRPPPHARRQEALEQLGFDPASVLLRDAGLLAEPRFLAAFHEELRASFGEEAPLVLFQVGLLHGLQAALRQAQRTGRRGAEVGAPGRPPLALRFRVDGAGGSSLEIRGDWPDRAEWRALRSRRGGGGSRCHLSAGFASGWLSGLFETDLLALEQVCGAAGAPSCSFLAREPAAWQASGDPQVSALLARLPFAAFRELVREHLGDAAAGGAREAFDPEAPVIHIWGPLMVIPFSNADEAYRAVELIARDPAARNVSVVVVDLSGALLDEAFGASALEQIIEAVEGLGAEVVFAGASPLSERVIAELSRKPLLVHKDLDAAIASGFQIAESQRSGV